MKRETYIDPTGQEQPTLRQRTIDSGCPHIDGDEVCSVCEELAKVRSRKVVRNGLGFGHDEAVE